MAENKRVRKRPNRTFSLRNLIQITKAWLEYNAINNKDYALIEEAIRIPICDYLAQVEGEIILEKTIEEFENNKKFDLYFKPQSGKSYYFEFKYVQEDYTSKPSEIERYFDDILRLRTKAKESNTECYLLAFGVKDDFEKEFKNLKGKLEEDSEAPEAEIEAIDVEDVFNPFNQDANPPKKRVGRPPKYGQGNIYEEMFSFIENEKKTIDFNNEYVIKLKDAFEDNYKLTETTLSDYPHYIEQLYKVKTTCSYLLFDKDIDFTGLGVWKVEADDT